MNEIELLRHVLKNREEGKPAGDGLLFGKEKSRAKNVYEIKWYVYHSYTLAPKTQIINGQEVPVPLKDLTGISIIYVINLTSGGFYTTHKVEYMSNEYLEMIVNRGLVFASKKDAIKVAKAMLNIKE